MKNKLWSQKNTWVFCVSLLVLLLQQWHQLSFCAKVSSTVGSRNPYFFLRKCAWFSFSLIFRKLKLVSSYSLPTSCFNLQVCTYCTNSLNNIWWTGYTVQGAYCSKCLIANFYLHSLQAKAIRLYRFFFAIVKCIYIRYWLLCPGWLWWLMCLFENLSPELCHCDNFYSIFGISLGKEQSFAMSICWS